MSQNSYTSSSNPRRFLTGFMAGTVLLLLLVPGLWLAWFMGPIQGDLARVGKLGERYFAMQAPQETLKRRANPPASPAEILVVGDSSAAENVWQSFLSEKTGLDTLTYHYDDLPCIENWVNDAINRKLSADVTTVIVSTVERKFLARFGRTLKACEKKPYDYRPIAEATLPHQRSAYDVFPMNIAYLLGTATHQVQLTNRLGRRVFDNTVVVDLERKDLFSHQTPGKLLYFSNDDKSRMQGWSPDRMQQAIGNLQRYVALAATRGVQLIVVVVPDKSSVYYPWVSAGQIPLPEGYRLFEELEMAFGPAANLLPAMREQAEKTQDFYASNDSHPSIKGYRILSGLIAGRVQMPHNQTSQ